MKNHALLLSLGALLLLSGCGTSQEFPAVPEGVNLSHVPHQTVAITAERFHFTPDLIRVKHGTLLEIQITAIDGTHGFKLGAFGIDVTIPEKETKTVSVYVENKGEYGFKCSHFCGIGHFGMKGKLIVE